MRGEKFVFTNEQVKYIIDNWGKESAYSMKKKFNCSWYAIVSIAKEQNLELPKSNNWTIEEIDTLKELAKKYHYEDIAVIMNKTQNSIYLKAKRLGIVLTQDRREWTIEEEKYLYEHWGIDKIEKIANNMNRSIYSIKVKSTRMKLGRMSEANIDQINVSDIANILGIRTERITDTWIRYGLKLKKKKVTNNYSYYCIEIDNLMIFLKEHQNLWDSRNLEKNILGKEPDWLLEKRKSDLNNSITEYKRWTIEELELVKKLILQGYTYDEIAQEINHTKCAIEYKIRELGLSYKLPKYWKGNELKYLKENYLNMSYKDIAKYLGRTTKAVSAKALELGYQKKLTNKKGSNKNE